MLDGSAIQAFILTLIAGLSTGLGGVIVVVVKRKGKWLLGFSLGFAAGVMTALSFGDLLPESTQMLLSYYQVGIAGIITVVAFLCGLLIGAAIDKFVPEINGDSVGRAGIVSMIAMVIHNLPEGIATFMAGYQDINLGISIAVAIALHNIPEGISIAIPIYYSTGKKSKAIAYALLSGLSEPIGALLTAMLFWRFINDQVLGVLFGVIGGIMVYIALNELFLLTEKITDQISVLVGVISGALIMLLAL